MQRKAILGIVLPFLLSSLFLFGFNVRQVNAGGTIYIRTDGSIDPPTAPIVTSDNVTYFLTDSINGSIVAGKSNIVINGSGYSLQGSGSGNGISNEQGIDGITLTIDNIQIQGFGVGVFVGLVMSASCSLARSSIINNGRGIEITSMHTNFNITANNIVSNSGVGIHIGDCVGQISGNNVANNGGHGISAMDATCFISENNVTGNLGDGINLPMGGGGEIFENNISDNKGSGIRLGSSNNRIFHNIFENNGDQVIEAAFNQWDDGYPSGGNCWRDYNGTDVYSGPYQNETGSDGIGDTSYIIDANNIDHYPLMRPPGALLGDVNYDRKINLKDVMMAIQAFNSFRGQFRWNPDADTDNSGRVDMRDIIMIVLNFNKHE